MYRVLIVDDEPMALYSTAHSFEWARFGFDEPVTTTESLTALDLLRSQTFDAAIVDIRMPLLSGIDLIRIAREENLDTVFVVLSGYSDFDYVQNALRLQAFDYCLKPIQPDAAHTALTRLTQHIRTRRCATDPNLIASMGTAAPLHRLYALRGMNPPDGALSMALIAADAPDLLSGRLSELKDSLLLWAGDNRVLAFTSLSEAMLPEVLRRLSGTQCCYTQPVLQDALNPAKQYQLLSETLLTMHPGQEPLALRVNNCSPAFFELLNYVDSHLGEDLSLQQLSTRFHLNYTYCSELFRSITGQTFTKYLTSHRMEQAANLIANTALSMTEIARQTGYGNYNHFSATFKACYGQTPGAYRNQRQHQGDG